MKKLFMVFMTIVLICSCGMIANMRNEYYIQAHQMSVQSTNQITAKVNQDYTGYLVSSSDKEQ